MRKFLTLFVGIVIIANVFGQEWDPYGFEWDINIRTLTKHDILYSRIPNHMWLFVAASRYEKSDVFELKVASPSIIEKKKDNHYLVTPMPNELGIVNFYLYKNQILVDSLELITREPPTPQVNNYPHVSCRSGFYIPYVDHIDCDIDLNWRTRYELRVLSFQFVIKDTNGIVRYTKFVKGNKFSEEDKIYMKKVIDEIKDYRFDYIDVHVTDDRFYRATFSEISTNARNPSMRFYEQE